MRVLMAGGGSGGHVTPLRAIVQSLRTANMGAVEISVISDRAFYGQTKFLFKDTPDVTLKKIYSGKFRRYNSKSLLWHLTHWPTVFKNLRDIILIALGIAQSIVHFIFNKPDVVFCKGGYVCVPVGIAARIFRVPLIIHDSDTHPGLTNRFLSRWAVKIGTGMPAKYYQYPADKMVYSGIPVQKDFKPTSQKDQESARRKLNLAPTRPTVLVTGGGTGAKELNNALSYVAQELIEQGWQIILVTGKGKAAQVAKRRASLKADLQKAWLIEEFAEMLPLVNAADVIITRAGATAMQEFANAQKAVIVVPNPYLTGGHQLKNAAMFKENDAALVLQEIDVKEKPELLVQTLNALLEDTKRADVLAQNLYKKFAKPHAADEIAAIVSAELVSKK
jgi:UDP-N-acetylglucosamine--N-acetylmuramyl-(pentapeptide) pyrophosphoryl-undecaprenol N-acetylglucosamine transferase